ncbi:hypothetical protein KOR34_11710 [Posidoniimonas corsicana]|uniref:SLA1 homology domain-containing protein n=2 Tax=Posidoniimonas corsicana TaxID=1938618 RepID=A0A5C5VE85_9BACT|nr:hypothetical protein KOR34_11710 [Posidoniimonas corsicana]
MQCTGKLTLGGRYTHSTRIKELSTSATASTAIRSWTVSGAETRDQSTMPTLCYLPLAIVLVSSLLSTCTADEPRVWRSESGRFSFEASFYAKYDDVLELRRTDGTLLRIPIPMLSEDDREYAAKSAENSFTIAGIAQIASPPGYHWTLERELTTDLGALKVFACTAHGPENGAMVMTVSPQVAIGNRTRVAHLKGHWNGIVETIHSKGWQVVVTTKPPLDGVIPDRVEYELTTLDPDKNPTLIRGVTVFSGERTFIFQIREADNVKESSLHSISESLKIHEYPSGSQAGS